MHIKWKIVQKYKNRKEQYIWPTNGMTSNQGWGAGKFFSGSGSWLFFQAAPAPVFFPRCSVSGFCFFSSGSGSGSDSKEPKTPGSGSKEPKTPGSGSPALELPSILKVFSFPLFAHHTSNFHPLLLFFSSHFSDFSSLLTSSLEKLPKLTWNQPPTPEGEEKLYINLLFIYR